MRYQAMDLEVMLNIKTEPKWFSIFDYEYKLNTNPIIFSNPKLRIFEIHATYLSDFDKMDKSNCEVYKIEEFIHFKSLYQSYYDILAEATFELYKYFNDETKLHKFELSFSRESYLGVGSSYIIIRNISNVWIVY